MLEYAESPEIGNEIREKYLDSSYAVFVNSRNDSVTRRFLKRTAINYYSINSYDKAIAASHKYYSMAEKERDTSLMANALYVTGISYSEKGNNDSAFFYYKEAEKLYLDIGNEEDLAGVILYKAYIYFELGEYVLCESEAIKALSLLQEQQRTVEVYQCYSLIGTALDGQNNNEAAIKYFQYALNELKNFKEQGYGDDAIIQYRASCYNNMGLVYIKIEQYDMAVSMYREALNYTNIRFANPTLYARLLNNLASAKLKKGDYTELPGLFLESLKIRDSLGEISDIVSSRYNLGEYYTARNDTARAVKYLQKAYQDAKTMRSSFDILNSLKLLSKIDKKNDAFYSDKYIEVNDSLQEKAKADRNRFARIAYETDRLETEKEELAKRNTFIIGISAVVLLFIAAIFIIYYLNSRNKKLLLIQDQQRANEEIYQLMFDQQFKVDAARAEEKTRIAMELHDGILNNIYAVRLNLEFSNRKVDPENVEKRKAYIKELQQVESEIRSVSHDLSRNVIFEQNQNFDSMLSFMVTSQKNTSNTEFEAYVDKAINWDSIPNTTKINVYRIIQEALQNINKYANATLAAVNVLKEESSIKIVVTDNGAGFDVAKASGGIGLKNLKKRADTLNGNLTIESAPGQGTSINVQFPY